VKFAETWTVTTLDKHAYQSIWKKKKSTHYQYDFVHYLSSFRQTIIFICSNHLIDFLFISQVPRLYACMMMMDQVNSFWFILSIVKLFIGYEHHVYVLNSSQCFAIHISDQIKSLHIVVFSAMRKFYVANFLILNHTDTDEIDKQEKCARWETHVVNIEYITEKMFQPWQQQLKNTQYFRKFSKTIYWLMLTVVNKICSSMKSHRTKIDK
jgi:hypothetical protein